MLAATVIPALDRHGCDPVAPLCSGRGKRGRSNPEVRYVKGRAERFRRRDQTGTLQGLQKNVAEPGKFVRRPVARKTCCSDAGIA